MKKLKVIFFLLSIVLTITVQGQLKLPALIGNGMVLQRNTPLQIWGWANVGEQVTVTFNGKTYTTVADNDKKWSVKVNEMKEGGPYEMQVSTPSVKKVIKDILIGDVWIASGQSNMAFKMKQTKDKYPDEIAQAANPNIRQFAIKTKYSFEKPLDDVTSSGWKPVTPQNIPNFTAVGYFFAKNIYEKYKVPVGIILSSWGGTPAEAWVSEDVLPAFPHYQRELQILKESVQLKQAIDSLPTDTKKPQSQPASLYNGMIAPLLPYSIKGVIWYQGEANTSRAKEYQSLFPALINDWRQKWQQGEFPFLFVQLANYRASKPEPSESRWAELREAQLMTLSVPRTGMAVTSDIGEWNDIHPLNKSDVGKRLALAAEKIAYNENKIVYSGPIYESMQVKKNKATITFKHIGSGLVAKNDTKLQGFSVAGQNKKFVWANARIEGGKVVVWNDTIDQPIAVRYAWAENPEGANLYNKEGLPASPFRTDTDK